MMRAGPTASAAKAGKPPHGGTAATATPFTHVGPSPEAFLQAQATARRAELAARGVHPVHLHGSFDFLQEHLRRQRLEAEARRRAELEARANLHAYRGSHALILVLQRQALGLPLSAADRGLLAKEGYAVDAGGGGGSVAKPVPQQQQPPHAAAATSPGGTPGSGSSTSSASGAAPAPVVDEETALLVDLVASTLEASVAAAGNGEAPHGGAMSLPDVSAAVAAATGQRWGAAYEPRHGLLVKFLSSAPAAAAGIRVSGHAWVHLEGHPPPHYPPPPPAGVETSGAPSAAGVTPPATAPAASATPPGHPGQHAVGAASYHYPPPPHLQGPPPPGYGQPQPGWGGYNPPPPPHAMPYGSGGYYASLYPPPPLYAAQQGGGGWGGPYPPPFPGAPMQHPLQPPPPQLPSDPFTLQMAGGLSNSAATQQQSSSARSVASSSAPSPSAPAKGGGGGGGTPSSGATDPFADLDFLFGLGGTPSSTNGNKSGGGKGVAAPQPALSASTVVTVSAPGDGARVTAPSGLPPPPSGPPRPRSVMGPASGGLVSSGGVSERSGAGVFATPQAASAAAAAAPVSPGEWQTFEADASGAFAGKRTSQADLGAVVFPTVQVPSDPAMQRVMLQPLATTLGLATAAGRGGSAPAAPPRAAGTSVVGSLTTAASADAGNAYARGGDVEVVGPGSSSSRGGAAPLRPPPPAAPPRRPSTNPFDDPDPWGTSAASTAAALAAPSGFSVTGAGSSGGARYGGGRGPVAGGATTHTTTSSSSYYSRVGSSGGGSSGLYPAPSSSYQPPSSSAAGAQRSRPELGAAITAYGTGGSSSLHVDALTASLPELDAERLARRALDIGVCEGDASTLSWADFDVLFRPLLTAGFVLVKHGRHGSAKRRRFWVPSSMNRLYWETSRMVDVLRSGERHLEFSDVITLVDGIGTELLRRKAARGEIRASEEGRFFSLVTASRSYDFEAATVSQRKVLVRAFNFLVSRLARRDVLVSAAVSGGASFHR